MGRRILLFFVNSWMIIHLGRKPVRGGRPPSESIIIRVLVAISGVLFHMWDKDRIVVEWDIISSINTTVVITI